MINDEIEKRVFEVGKYVADTGATVRCAAVRFGTSKSTVHKDLTERLRFLDAGLYKRVLSVLAKNRAERHLRGGDATKRKYGSKKKKDKK
jgi:putative DeoR family transcriptional regulator (stage III sporulation protein D)